MSTVRIDVAFLAQAKSGLTTLANNIDTQRASAQHGTPIALTSLSNSSALARSALWLHDQEGPLQQLIDLGTLLETDGSGIASYEGDGSFGEIEALLVKEIVDQVKDFDDMDSVNDREQMEEFATILARYAHDPDISGAVVNGLEAEGAVHAFYDMQSWLTEQSQPNYRGGEYIDTNAERQRIQGLQDDLAGTLATMIGTAGREGRPPLDADFGRQMVESDGRGWGVATLFDYGSANNVDFGENILVSAGEALLEREEVQGSRYWDGPMGGTSILPFGTNQDDDQAMNDPTLQWLQVLDNNADASQTILLDTDRAKYLLGERESTYEDNKGAAAGDVLRVATVDQALGYNPKYDDAGSPEDVRARNAAQISSNTLDMFGEGAEALGGVDEEIGGIIATYIADVDRTATRSPDGGPGTYSGEHPRRPDFLEGSDLPYYGINIDKDDLTDILEDVGDNETANSTIGGAAARYNQVRLNDGASVSLEGNADGQPSWTIGEPGDPMVKAIHESSQLQGYLQDSLINGAIDGAEDEAEAKRKVASMFTLPLDYVPVPGGPAGNFIVGEIKDQIIDGYVGDGVNEAISAGNDQYETGRRHTRLQAYYAVLGAESENPWGELNAGDQTRVEERGDESQYLLGGLRDSWPGAETGNPVPPSELSDDQIRAILDEAEQVPGYGGTVGSTVDTAWDNLAKPKGGN